MISSSNDADPQYVKLSCSSITPSQSMQYEEITKKLHTPMFSVVMATVSEELHDDATHNQMLTSNTDPSLAVWLPFQEPSFPSCPDMAKLRPPGHSDMQKSLSCQGLPTNST